MVNIFIQILQRFLHTKSRSSQLGAVDPLKLGAEDTTKSSRVTVYDKERDRCDQDTTSRLRFVLHRIHNFSHSFSS
jgi:deoxyribodipyrimidine photo-lyase